MMQKTAALVATLGSIVVFLWHVQCLAAAQGGESAPSKPKRSCIRDFVGSDFLSGAHARGIAPVSNCFAVDLMSNSFHAPPASPCTLTLDTTKWLVPGWQFAGLTGSGRFQTSAASGTLVVTINAGGGFLLRSVRVTTVELMDPAQCEATKVTDVLR